MQEGSTSLEIGDSMESDEKQLLPTTSTRFSVSSPTTEAPEMSSKVPTDSPTALYRPSGNAVLFDSSTVSYEEASGLEPDVLPALTKGHIALDPTTEPKTDEDTTEDQAIVSKGFVWNFSPSGNVGGETNEVTILNETVKVTPNPKDGAQVTPTTFEREAVATLNPIARPPIPFTIEEEIEATVKPDIAIFEEEATASVPPQEIKVTTTINEEAKDTVTQKGLSTATMLFEAEATLTPKHENTDIPVFEEDAKAFVIPKEGSAVTQMFEEDKAAQNSEGSAVTPILEEPQVTLSPKDETEVITIFKDDAKGAVTQKEGPTLMQMFEFEATLNPEESMTVTTIFEEEAEAIEKGSQKLNEEATPTPKEGPTVTQMLEMDTKAISNPEESTALIPIFEEEAKSMPNVEKVGQRFDETSTIAQSFDRDTTTPAEHEQESGIFEKEAKITSTFAENVTPSFQEKANTLFEAEAQETTTALDDSTSSTDLAFDEITVLPYDSEASHWALLTTTTGPQESLKDLEISTKSSYVSSTVRATTWRSKRTWSPPTAASPDVFRGTSETWTSTTTLEPDDNPTQVTTDHVLPNEKTAAAAAAGKVKVAGNTNVTFLGLTVLIFLTTH